MRWKLGLIAGAIVAAPLAAAIPAFAATPVVFPLNLPTTNAVKIPANTTSIPVTITNFDSALTPPSTLEFDFVIPGDNNPADVMAETGTLSSGTTYSVPVPNYGHAQTVYIESSYTGANGGLGITIDGPLIDTLPEVALAAALPLGMLGVWYLSRRRRRAGAVT